MKLSLLIALMTAVLPSKIDSEKEESRHFIGYQLDWIRDDSQMRIWEKSFRIGATWADGFKNVRKRLQHAKRDYLFATKDYPSALEYMQGCRQFCDVFNVAKGIVSHGEDLVKVPIIGSDGKDTGFTEEVKMGYIKFDNGSRIIAFSANPNAMLVYGGDVGLDEFSRHQRAAELYAIAQARITWGYDLGIWSSHKGTDSEFYTKIQQARAGRGGWSYHKTTIEDAVRQGLVEKINATRGTNFTREQFIADCRNRAGDESVYQETYMCNPQGGTAPIVPWSQLELCMQDAVTERVHLEHKQLVEAFGEFSEAGQESRGRKIADFLNQGFPKLFATPGRHTLGYDVAASGEGDLAAIYVDRVVAGSSHLHGLLTFRTEDWDFHKRATRHFMDRVAGVTGAGDETGLGRQICWELAKKYQGRFDPVNFSTEKHDMGFALMNRLSVAEKKFPRPWQDVAADYFALRKTWTGSKWIFTAGTNNHNAASHCDIAWAGALSDRARLIAGGFSSELI
jgi:phage FluMu gp28-like protein